MKSGFLGKATYHSAILLACFTLGARPQQPVVLAPAEDDLVVLNGCVISACNYLAVVKTQHSLDKDFWAKILLVRYDDHPAGHAYCVWETDGTIYGYDRNAGSFPIPVYTRDARAIAIVLAQELGKVLNENLSVSRAEFVESNKRSYTNTSCHDVAPSQPGQDRHLHLALVLGLAPSLLLERLATRSILECLKVRPIFFRVFLMIILSRIKFHRGQNLSGDGFLELARLRQFFL